MIISPASLGESIEKLLEKVKSIEQGGQLQNEYIKINSFSSYTNRNWLEILMERRYHLQ